MSVLKEDYGRESQYTRHIGAKILQPFFFRTLEAIPEEQYNAKNYNKVMDGRKFILSEDTIADLTNAMEVRRRNTDTSRSLDRHRLTDRDR